jgi:hypothetical protein
MKKLSNVVRFKVKTFSDRFILKISSKINFTVFQMAFGDEIFKIDESYGVLL